MSLRKEKFTRGRVDLLEPATYDEFLLSFWNTVRILIHSYSVLHFYEFSECFFYSSDADSIGFRGESCSCEIHSTLENVFLIDDDHIVSLPYDDIKWFHKGCDLCRRLPCYLESGTECDELARIARCISIRCPVEDPRAVPSIEYPLLLHGSIESILWSIECLEVGYSSERIASPDIWFPNLGSETVDDRTTCGEYYVPLSERSRYLIHLEKSRIDIVRITIIRIFFARHFEEGVSILRKDLLHMYDRFREKDSLSRIYLLPIIEYQ